MTMLFAALHESGCGPKPKCRDVHDLVAIEWKADTTRTSLKCSV